MQTAKGRYARFTRHWADTLRVLSSALDVLAALAAAVTLIAITFYVGFDSTVVSYGVVGPWLRASQGVFVANILFNLIFRFRSTVAGTRPFRWAIDMIMLATLIPLLTFHGPHAEPSAIHSFLYSRLTFVAIIGIYAAIYLSFVLIRIPGRHTNPSLILSTSFLTFIVIGSGLLLLPRCTVGGISVIDSIFVSTSAVCICGLTPVDVSTTFTPLGLCILAALMQIGALGVMTFTSFFALFFSGQTSVYSQLMVRDMFYSKTINSLLPTLLYTLLFTLSVEAIGAVAIYFSVVDTIPGYTTSDYLVFSAFHSLSAFCNAGFSTIGNGLSNPVLLRGNQIIYLVISCLVIAGGIGFPILVNAKEALFARARQTWAKLRRRNVSSRPHLYNLNSRVVLITTSLLFLLTAVLFYLFERNGVLAGMSPYEKIVQSLFNATTPRSSGFVSVNPAAFAAPTLVVVMLMMWIGGGSQSTAGGIKVNTFAAAMLHLKAVVTGRSSVRTFNRRISADSLSRAQAVIILSIVSYAVLSVAMLLIEPALPPKWILFESMSALMTVGSSLGATPLLSAAGKAVLSVAMFIGRVGLLSLLVGFAGKRIHPAIELPEDNLIIN